MGRDRDIEILGKTGLPVPSLLLRDRSVRRPRDIPFEGLVSPWGSPFSSECVKCSVLVRMYCLQLHVRGCAAHNLHFKKKARARTTTGHVPAACCLIHLVSENEPYRHHQCFMFKVPRQQAEYQHRPSKTQSKAHGNQRTPETSRLTGRFDRQHCKQRQLYTPRKTHQVRVRQRMNSVCFSTLHANESEASSATARHEKHKSVPCCPVWFVPYAGRHVYRDC